MNLSESEVEVNARLREKGIQHTIRELECNPVLHPDCGAELLELFKHSSSLYSRTHIAEALFARKLNRQQRQEAVETLQAFIKQNAERWGSLESLVLNELHNNVDPNHVHEIAQMTFDKQFGPLRSCFVEVLGKIGNADAISYLLRAAKESETASAALSNLARLRVEGTLELCEKALKRSDLDANSREVIKETHSKLKRQLAKNPYASSHLMKESVPDGLEEWSANLDGGELGKALRNIQKCISSGFNKKEVLEVMVAADDLGIHEKVRFKFLVSFGGSETILYLEIFCDDTDAFDLSVFGLQALVNLVDKIWNKGE